MTARTGIVVAQLGGPESLAEVRPFIRSIFADPHLVPLPGGSLTRTAVSTLVAGLRAPRVRSHYKLIGRASPLVETTRLQANMLGVELAARGQDVVVAVAHRHSRPDTSAAVDAMLAAGVGRVVMLPLYPQHSDCTTGSSEVELRRTLSEYGADLPLTIIRSWCRHPSYLAAQAQLVDEMLAGIPGKSLSTALLVFSAHGLPQRIVDGGDPYPEEVRTTVAGVMSRVQRPVDHVIAYQSRSGPIRWIGPDVGEVIATAASDSRTWLGVVPISFVSDHVETLYEIDIEMKDHAAAVGIDNFHRSRCLGIDPIVGPMLADIVQEVL